MEYEELLDELVLSAVVVVVVVVVVTVVSMHKWIFIKKHKSITA